jgi:hypothetical protein
VKVPAAIRFAICASTNFHRQGKNPNIFLFATARGGSTWVMEILASQAGMKYYDEPFNIRRQNVARTGLFPDWASLMPDTGDTERIVSYLNRLASGGYRYMNPLPLRRNHRWLTNRIVFKIHELEHLIGTIARRCSGTIVYLLRHPVPTTLSRRTFPRLDLFLGSRYYQDLIGSHRLGAIQAIGRTGSHFQRGIISWCYENLVPLRFPDFAGLFVTYEELVLNPERACDLFLERLQLTDRAAMRRAFSQAAANINMSSAQTQTLLADSDERRRRLRLVTKWQDSIAPREQAQAAEILDLFGLCIYAAAGPLATRQYLHFSDTESLATDPGTPAGGKGVTPPS